MNSDLIVEDSFALTPNHIIQNRRSGRRDISYWLEDATRAAVFVSIAGREQQRIPMLWRDITFGKRAYFECACGASAAKLYLPNGGKEFKCRECHGLQYQLTTFNRNSVAGKILYRTNRLRKLADSRAEMGRILYNGDYTKKFERFLGLCDRAGYHDIVKGANDLRALIKAE